MRPLKVAIAFLCCFGVLASLKVRPKVSAEDFVSFYTGAALVGTPDLYNRAAHLRFHAEQLHIEPRPDLVSPRLPYYSFLISPFVKLPYADALPVWRWLMVAFLGLFAWLFPFGNRLHALAAVSISLPVILSWKMGQDVALLLPPMALALAAYKNDRRFLAGVFLSLCATKYHFLVLIPIAIIAKREWRFLGGMSAGGAALLLFSCAVQGVGWFGDYIATLLKPEINLLPDQMLGFVELTALLPYKAPLWVALSCLAVAASVLASIRNSFPVGMSACLIAAVLVSPHAYLHDAVILIPPLLVIAHERPALRLPVWLQLLPVSPFFTFLLAVAGRGYSPILDTALEHCGLYYFTAMEFYVLLRVALPEPANEAAGAMEEPPGTFDSAAAAKV